MKKRVFQVALTLALLGTLPGCAVMQAAFAIGIGAGYLAMDKSMRKARLGAQDASVRGNLRTVQLALEQYAIDHDTYPTNDEFAAAITRDDYLPGNKFPETPWAKQDALRQTNNPDIGLLEPARNRLNSSRVGTPLGTGHAPTGPVYDNLTYGAVLYDYDADADEYVVYGIGERNGRAVVVGVFISDMSDGEPEEEPEEDPEE